MQHNHPLPLLDSLVNYIYYSSAFGCSSWLYLLILVHSLLFSLPNNLIKLTSGFTTDLMVQAHFSDAALLLSMLS